MLIKRDAQEIDRLYDKAMDRSGKKSIYPGMTYEEGIIAAIDYLTDKTIKLNDILGDEND